MFSMQRKGGKKRWGKWHGWGRGTLHGGDIWAENCRKWDSELHKYQKEHVLGRGNGDDQGSAGHVQEPVARPVRL